MSWRPTSACACQCPAGDLFRLFGVSVCAAMLVGAAGGVASAGEVTGNGKKLEIHARSVCAFSGLDDIDEDEDPTETTTDDFGRTQNFGQIVKVAGPMGGVPSFTCNPVRGGEGH